MKKRDAWFVIRGSSLAASLLLFACSEIPKEAYFNRGDPENLLDVSSEVVTLNLASPSAAGDLAALLAEEETPARAELGCDMKAPPCMQARETLTRYGVPVETVSAAAGDVTLYFERVVARDCENRYIDNSINPYNLHHPVFGCSITGNMVQQVTNRQEFVNPSLMDYPDAQKAAQTYRAYQKPPKNEAITSGKSIVKGSGGVQ